MPQTSPMSWTLISMMYLLPTTATASLLNKTSPHTPPIKTPSKIYKKCNMWKW